MHWFSVLKLLQSQLACPSTKPVVKFLINTTLQRWEGSWSYSIDICHWSPLSVSPVFLIDTPTVSSNGVAGAIVGQWKYWWWAPRLYPVMSFTACTLIAALCWSVTTINMMRLQRAVLTHESQGFCMTVSTAQRKMSHVSIVYMWLNMSARMLI